MGDDGFVIKTDGTKLWIVGGEQRGTLYGVYEFLESYLGCRFYAADYEKVPTTQNITLEIAEDKQLPIILSRFSHWTDSYSRSYAVKRKLNLTWRENMPEELGGSVYYVGPSKTHTIRHLSETTDKHGTYEQPCMTDEEVYNTTLKNVRAYLSADPNARLISVSQEDGGEVGICKCENCMAAYEKFGGWTGVFLDFVNRIARDIRDEFPDVIIHTLAYNFTVEPPKDMIPEDNIMIQLCVPGGECLRHPYSEQCEGSVLSQNGEMNFVELLEKWSEVCDYIAVWDYTTNFSHYNLPFPNFEALRENIRFFADNNVKYAFIQGNSREIGEFDELRAYLINKLLWDPYMSEEEYWGLMNEFLMDYYGPGGEKIGEYISILLEETKDIHMYANIKPKELFGMTLEDVQVLHEDGTYPDELTMEMLENYEDVDWSVYWNYFKTFSPEEPRVLTEGKRLFAEALAMAETDEQRAHIDETSIQLDYLESYVIYEKYSLGKIDLNNPNSRIKKDEIYTIIKNFSTANPDVLPTSEQNKYYYNIIRYIREQMESPYVEFNKQLAEKMIRYGIYHIHDSEDLTDMTAQDFSKPPYSWSFWGTED